MKQIYFNLFLFITLCLGAQASFAQQNRGTIKGKVYTSDNKPADNVSVALKGTRYGTITNDNGEYTFKAPAGNYTLVVMYVGVQSVENTIEVNAGRTVTVPDVTINTSGATLQEVSINGRNNKFSVKKSYDVAKMPLSNLENPQSYSTVTKELAQEQAVFSADQAIKNVPGISTLWSSTNRAGDGGGYFTLRGFSVAASLWNGVSGTVSNTIDATDLERVEVIKGPSGTLYGSTLTSFGGLINRVTKSPYEQFGGNISFSAGSYSFNRASIDLNTPLDSAKKALFRLNASYNYTNSFQDAGYDRRVVFAPSFSYKVSDKLSFLFDAEILHGKGTTPQLLYFDYNTTIAGIGVNRADQLNIDYKKSYINNDIASSSDNINFFGQALYKFSDKWTSQTTIASNYSSSDGPQSYFYLLAGNSSLARMVWSINGNATALQVQQNFNGDFKIGGLRNRLLMGLDFTNQRANITFSSYNATPTSQANFYTDLFDVVSTIGAVPNYNNFNLANISAKYAANGLASPYKSVYNRYTTSAYASDVLNITDNLLAMASLRVDHFRNNPIYDATTNSYSGQGYSQTALSPKFGLVYQVVKDRVSLFGNYMNGFVNPGYYNAYDPNSATGLVNKIAKPEHANQAEGGVKLDLFNGKLSSTISYYDIQVSNLLRTDPLHANASSQDGTQLSRGFEAEVIANPITGLNVVAGYAHNNSKITKSTSYDEGYRPATAGSPDLANLWISYRLTKGAAQGLGLGFGGNYASDNKVVNNSASGTFILPAYTVLNSALFYEQHKYRLGLNVNNLTNKKYWIGYTTVDPQMLRQIILSVAYKF